MKTLEEFIGKLVEEKGFDTTDEEVITQIKADLLSRFEDRVNAMIINNVPEEMLGDFEKVADSGNDDEMEAFIKKNVPDFEEKLATEMISFKSMYLG